MRANLAVADVTKLIELHTFLGKALIGSKMLSAQEIMCYFISGWLAVFVDRFIVAKF